MKWMMFPMQRDWRSLRWALRTVYVAFMRLPRWVRTVALVWIFIALMSRGCSESPPEPPTVTPATAEKLKAIAGQFQGSMDKGELAKLGAQIAHELAATDGATPSDRSPLLAIPFSAPAGDNAAEKFATSTFAMVYGRIAITSHGLVGLPKEPLLSPEFGAALERARANHSTYVLHGTIESPASGQVLAIKIGTVEDGSTVWAKSYPLAGADPVKIAADVESKLPALEEN